MAHSLYTPEQAASSSLAALRYLSVLPRTVRQDFSADFVPGAGTVVNVRGPITTAEARTYTQANRDARDAITFDDLTETTYPVTLEDQVYSAVRLPDDFATFTLAQMEQQVLIPQARSVVRGVTTPLLTEMETIASDGSIPALALDGSNALEVIVATRAVLNAREVPLEGRTLAVGPEAEAALLRADILVKANESGSDSQLRTATIGKIFGFDVVVEPQFTDNFSIAYNRDAFAHVTRPSRNPEGAGSSATVSSDGFALRWLRHYNPTQLEDQSVLDTFVGADTLDADRAVSFLTAV